jgi:hypothetical protein
MVTFRESEIFRVDYDAGDLVQDWADEDGAEPIRVEAHRRFVEDVWGLHWNQRAEIVEAFRAAKRAHLEDIRRCASIDLRNGVRLFAFA